MSFPVILHNLPFSKYFTAPTHRLYLFSFCFPTSQPSAVKNTSTSYPLYTLPSHLSPCPKKALWVLTFQPQSFQSCSLAVIFISAALQQHRRPLSSIWSHPPPPPLQHPFFSIFSICQSLLATSCLPSWQRKQPPTIFPVQLSAR